MMDISTLGTPQHQSLLQAIVTFYANDPRILAVCLFGSLARGNWDEFSDLDLDIVIANQVEIDFLREIESLSSAFGAIGEKAALITPNGPGEGDVVLESLLEFSLRYHPLHTTNWKITESVLLLGGRISVETIKAAGQANYRPAEQPLTALVDRYLRYALGVTVQLHRQHIWTALELLHRMRNLLMELYARTHDQQRPVWAFDHQTDVDLHARLGELVAPADLSALQAALVASLRVLEQDLMQFTAGQIRLTASQRTILHALQARQTNRMAGR